MVETYDNAYCFQDLVIKVRNRDCGIIRYRKANYQV